MIDEFAVDVISDRGIELAMKCAFLEHAKATHVAAKIKDDLGGPQLIFAWHEQAGKEFTELPAPVDADGACEIALTWLREIQWPPRSDEDEHKAWRITTPSGMSLGTAHFYIICYVRPYWGTVSK